VRPGGWSLLGQTPLKIVDEAQGWFPISAGDKVLFERINNAEFERLNGERL
jgi:allophanate hydrolase subunit 1